MNDHGRTFNVKKGQVFQSSENPRGISLITDGYLKRYSITNQGNQSIQSIYGPGYVYPLTRIYQILDDQQIYTGREAFYYETITNASIVIIDEKQLETLIAENPLLYKDLFQVAGQRFHSNIHYLENLSLDSVYKRLAHQIAHLAELFGEKTDQGVRLQVPLRQQDLASILDVARETISINYNRLKEAGLIKGSTKMYIKDVDALLKAAYS